MLNLIDITELDVREKLKEALSHQKPNTEGWIILSVALQLSEYFSFTENRTYPRPDHPDKKKRKSLIYTLVAILISLRTTLENEQKAVLSLIEKFPTEDELFNANARDIEICILPAGMANKKALTIRRALDYVNANIQGGLESLDFQGVEEVREILLKIPGFGAKSADCFLSIGLGKPSIAVDVNVFRVTSWLFEFPWSDSPNYSNQFQVDTIKVFLDNNIPKDAFLCQIIHTYFLLFGKKLGAKHPTGPCLVYEFCNTCNKRKISQNLLF